MSLKARARGAIGSLWSQRRPLSLALLGGGGAFVLMANEHQVRHGALYGALCMLLCVGGLLRALGLLRETETPAIALSETVWAALPGEHPWIAPRMTAIIALLLLLTAALALGAAALPWAIGAALLLLLPAALRRPGLLVFTLVSALYLPLLGTFGLWDPWETHYGEVSREILSRDDWISLWWAQDRWFWSKPIFIFWSEALVWSASGVGYLPDSNFAHSEWVLRLPTYLVSISAVLAVYFGMARFFGRRAALLCSLVLATMPYYAFLTHQAITDMPFVGTMTIAIMLLTVALQEDPEREVRSYRIGRLCISAHEIVLGLFLLVSLSQILYLASRNVTFIDGLFAWHRDEFMSGSGHNPDVPGNAPIRGERPRFAGFFAQPMAQALYWGVACAFVTAMLRRQRRAQTLSMMAFYLLCGLSLMAKGLPGVALPGLCALLVLLTCQRFSLLFEGRLHVALGGLLTLIVSLPWFVAMYIRHGQGFIDRIFIHDHINRLTSGVHGDNGSIEYFIEQLGYGMFPWVALVPLALGSWLHLRPTSTIDVPAERARRETLTLLGLWFAAAFTLFSAMTTKFHHYIFPAVPAAAMLIGLTLDRLLGASTASTRRAWAATLLALLAPLPLVLGAGGLRGNLRGVLPDGVPMAARATWVWQNGLSPWLCAGLLALGVALLAGAVFLHGRRRADDAPIDERDTGIAVGLLAGAMLCAFVGRDLSWTTEKRPAGNERLIDLFVYNYDRPFPAHLDYRPIISGFAIVACVLLALAAVRALRPAMSRGFLSLCVLFTAFSLHMYMRDLTPHWSQQQLIKRYYGARKNKSEELVAWQMNWKGENFYAGNRVAVFTDLDNKAVGSWMDARKGKNAFFVFEHGRFNRFKTVAGKRVVRKLTTERDNNKFVLVKVAL